MLRKIETVDRPDLEPIENPSQVSGFQSPAGDYEQERLNILHRLITDPTNTFFFEASSDEMSLFGIKCGTILVVNRSFTPRGGMIVIVWTDGKWLVRQLVMHGHKLFLTNGQEQEKPLEVNEQNGDIIWGVVTWSCSPQLEVKKYVRTR